MIDIIFLNKFNKLLSFLDEGTKLNSKIETRWKVGWLQSASRFVVVVGSSGNRCWNSCRFCLHVKNDFCFKNDDCRCVVVAHPLLAPTMSSALNHILKCD